MDDDTAQLNRLFGTNVERPTPAEPPAADAPDDVLLDWYRRNPRLVATIQTEAVQFYTGLARGPFLQALGLDVFWLGVCEETARIARGTAATGAVPLTIEMEGMKRFRIALDARNVLEAIVRDLSAMVPQEAAALHNASVAAASGRNPREIVRRYPGLAAWQARRDAKAAAAAEFQQEVHRQQGERDRARNAEVKAAAARDLLGRLLGRGLALTVSKTGISARPATLLTAADREAIAAHRDEMAALLSAPAEVV